MVAQSIFHLVECSVLNSYVLDGVVKPEEHARKGNGKRDLLKFQIELAHQLVGGFTSHQHMGRPRTANSNLRRLTNVHNHWPVFVNKKDNCVVCREIIRVKNLPTIGNRHESKITCEACEVYLCITNDRDSFKRYHTLADYIYIF